MHGTTETQTPVLDAVEQVTSEEAYPEITAGVQNIRIARALAANVASTQGEDAAIHRYLYQHWRFAQKQEAFTQCIKKIAIVEMHHLDIFGELIRQLGGDPRFCHYAAGRCLPFYTGCLTYPRRLEHAVAANLAAEKHTYATYLRQAKTFRQSAPCVADILERIAQDEKLHIEIFQRWLNQLRGIQNE